MSKVVVTGSEGFIGRSLTTMLSSAGHEVVPLGRADLVFGDRRISNLSLESAIRNSQVMIHLAARAHLTHDSHDDPLGEYRRINLNGTLAAAEWAAGMGVSRFVFVSSIGVLGNTSGDRAFGENDVPAPTDPYAVSKWEAERALRSTDNELQTQTVVVRPPLSYGPHVKGNFLRLLRLVASGIPLPFGGIDNCRSYVGVNNLCDFLISAAFHPFAGGRTFHVSDGEDISTPQLLKIIAGAMGRKARLCRCPTPILRAAAGALGKRPEFERLTGNLRVDSQFARSTLGWKPVEELRSGMAEMVRWFMTTR